MSKIDRLRQRLAVTGMPDDFDEREENLNTLSGLPDEIGFNRRVKREMGKRKPLTMEDQQEYKFKRDHLYNEPMSVLDRETPAEKMRIHAESTQTHDDTLKALDEVINEIKNFTPEQRAEWNEDAEWKRDSGNVGEEFRKENPTYKPLTDSEYKKKYGPIDRRTPPSFRKKERKLRRRGLMTGKLRQRLAKLPNWKPKKGKYPVVHPDKYSTGGDLLDRITAARDYQLGLFTPEDEIKFYSQIIKNGLPNPYLRPDYGEAIQITKPVMERFIRGSDATINTGVISPTGEINWEQFEDLVGQLDKGLGEGKTPDEIADTAVVKKVRPSKPTDKDRGDVMEARLKQRIAQVRLAVRPKKVASTKQEVVNSMKEGKPMRTEKPLRHGERLPPTYETDGKNFLLYGNKILSKQGNGYQTHVKGFINDDNYVQITLDSLRDFGMKVDSKGVIDSTKQFFTKDGLAMETKTNGDLTKSDMIIPANEISEGRVLVNKYKPPTGIKRDTYPYTPDNLRNFAAESRRRVTSMQVNSEGKKVPEGTLKGDPSAIRKRSLSETATQPEDAKEINRILGLPEEQGLEKTFGKKKYDKEKTLTTYNKGKYRGIEGSKTHHTLFKEKFKEKNKRLPLARFKHIRNVKATPKGSFANPFANNPSNAIQLSNPEHKELHRLNPHSNFSNIMESKLRIARLKIARIRQRNISRGVPRIAMGQKALDVMNIFNKNPLRHRDRKGVGFTFDHFNNRFLNAAKRKEALEIRKIFGAEEGKNFGLNSITWTGDGPQKDLKIIQRDLHSVEDDYKKDPILGGYEDSFEATFGVSGSNEEILSQLNDDQRESTIIDPSGYAFFKDHAGKETRLTELE